MASKMDRGLDEIIADSRGNGSRNRRGDGDSRHRERQDYPREGARKTFQRGEARNLDSEWLHDRYEAHQSRRDTAPRRHHDSYNHSEPRGSKLRVENIHYDLTEDDLDELFARIGPVSRLQLLYDRAGRSNGTAYVAYEHREDAQEAVRQYDGANANGQPIRLVMLPGGSPRNPFDTAVMPSRPLADRISAPSGRPRSFSPRRRVDEDDAARRGIDRYIPGGGSRSRSPIPYRRGGRRPGVRREANTKDEQSNRGSRGNARPKKTQEELDAEMEDYFGGGGAPAHMAEPTNGSALAAGNDDIDMIE